MKRSAFGKVSRSCTNHAGSPPGNNTGQNTALSHFGMTSVAIALHLSTFSITCVTRHGGGHSQLFSCSQSCIKASTASADGAANRALNRGNCALRSFAKRSIECGPQRSFKSANSDGCNFQSSESSQRLNASADSFFVRGIYLTDNSIPLTSHNAQICVASTCNSDTIEPLLTMLGTAMLSVYHTTVFARSSCNNALSPC